MRIDRALALAAKARVRRYIPFDPAAAAKTNSAATSSSSERPVELMCIASGMGVAVLSKGMLVIPVVSRVIRSGSYSKAICMRSGGGAGELHSDNSVKSLRLHIFV
jgi:hypothetical protein